MRLFLIIIFLSSILYSCKENSFPENEISLSMKNDIAQTLSTQSTINNVFYLYQYFLKPAILSTDNNTKCPSVRKFYSNLNVLDSIIVDFDGETCENLDFKGRLVLEVINVNEYKIDLYDLKSAEYTISGTLIIDNTIAEDIKLNSSELLFVHEINPSISVNVDNEYKYISEKNNVGTYKLAGTYSFIKGLAEQYELIIDDNSLLLKTNCSYVFSGKGKLNVGVNTILYLDYITDTCSSDMIFNFESYLEEVKF